MFAFIILDGYNWDQQNSSFSLCYWFTLVSIPIKGLRLQRSWLFSTDIQSCLESAGVSPDSLNPSRGTPECFTILNLKQ